MTSAQVLGDLVRCTRYVVQTLALRDRQGYERVKLDRSPPSLVLKHLMLNMQKETTILMQGLDILYHCSGIIVKELTLYRSALRGAETQLLTDCGLQ